MSALMKRLDKLDERLDADSPFDTLTDDELDSYCVWYREQLTAAGYDLTKPSETPQDTRHMSNRELWKLVMPSIEAWRATAAASAESTSRALEIL